MVLMIAPAPAAAVVAPPAVEGAQQQLTRSDDPRSQQQRQQAVLPAATSSYQITLASAAPAAWAEQGAIWDAAGAQPPPMDPAVAPPPVARRDPGAPSSSDSSTAAEAGARNSIQNASSEAQEAQAAAQAAGAVFVPLDPSAAAPPAAAAAAAPSSAGRAGGPELLLGREEGWRPGAFLLDDTRINEVYRQLPAPPAQPPELPAVALPDIKRVVLPNGLRVLMLRDTEVPLVRGTLLMEGGQAASPPDKVGLSSITAAVQRSGGSLQHPGSVMDDRLKDLAAGIEAAAGPRAINIGFECSSEDIDEVLSLVAELVRQPAFPQDKLEVVRGQVLESLSHKNDSSPAVGRRELVKLVLGPDSLWARTPTKQGISSITRSDLQTYWSEWQRPDSSVLGIVGDFEHEALEESLARALGAWGPAEGQPPAPRPAPGRGEALGGAEAGPAPRRRGGGGGAGEVWLVDRPGAAQASVVAGERGISLLDSDAFPLSALNGVLNSFGGTLFDTLRTKEGLCYSVYGSWELPFDHPGLFVASGETSQPALFLRELRRVLDAAAKSPPAPDRLARAKQERLNSFVFNFATPASQLQRAAAYELLGVPQDFLFSYRSGIEAVTADDVQRAAAENLHAYQQVAVVVADAKSTLPALEAAGFEVRPLVLSDD